MGEDRSFVEFFLSSIDFIHLSVSTIRKISKIDHFIKSKSEKISYFILFHFIIFSIKSGNGRFFLVLKNRSLGSIRIVITVLIGIGKKKAGVAIGVDSLGKSAMDSPDPLGSTGLCGPSGPSGPPGPPGPGPGPSGPTVMELEPKTPMTSTNISTTNYDQSINQSNDRSINQTSDQSIDQLIEITSAKFTYTPKNPTKQNPIKKRKSDDMDEILLFTSNLNRQKINTRLQEAKTAMLEAYAMVENSHMLSIVNQINQLLDGNMKIVKIDTNIELLAMQAKLDMIIKNQSKLVTKSEMAKAAQGPKTPQTINSIKPPQIKSSSHETFKSTETPPNPSSIRPSIVSIVPITTAKHATTNSESWAQVVNRKTVKKIQKITMADRAKKVKIDEETA